MTASKIAKLSLGGFAVMVLSVAAYLGSNLIRFPTMSQLKETVGRILVYDRAIAAELSHNPEAGGIVGTSFPKAGKDNNRPYVAIAPIADVVILSPTRIAHNGHGIARISGLAISNSNDLELLSNTPAFTGTVSFDYKFLWDDNGRARVWRCDVWNLSVIGPAK